MLVPSLNFVLPETSVGIYFIFFSTEERKTYKKITLTLSHRNKILSRSTTQMEPGVYCA